MTKLPGLFLAVFIAIFGGFLSDWLGLEFFGTTKSPFSPVVLAILLGLVVRNLVGLNLLFNPGIQFSLKFILRAGIVLLGLKLSLSEIGSVGLDALPVVVVCIAFAIVLVILLGRLLNISARLATLIAVGTSICGATAIVATSPVIGAKQNETSYAVACIALFGLLAMLFYPPLARELFAGDASAAGIFLGTSVHDTAQVIGAGMAYEQLYGPSATLETATVTKMLRNLSMLIVIPLVSIWYHRRSASSGAATNWTSMVPLFVIGFAAMSLLRTVGDMGGGRAFGVLNAGDWQQLLGWASFASSFFLTAAMAAVGLSTNLKDIVRIGPRPLLMGLFAALAVGAASTALLKTFA